MKEPDKDMKLMGSLMREMAKVYTAEGESPRWGELRQQYEAVKSKRQERRQCA